MPAAPNIPAPMPAFLPFSEISALTSAISSRIRVLVWSESWRTSSAVDASGTLLRPAVSAMGVLLGSVVLIPGPARRRGGGAEAAREDRDGPDGAALLLLAAPLRAAAERGQRPAGLAESDAGALDGRHAGRLLRLAERGAHRARAGLRCRAEPALHLVVLHEALRQRCGASRDVCQRHVSSSIAQAVLASGYPRSTRDNGASTLHQRRGCQSGSARSR